ncbi:Integral membrane protein required for efficient mating [Komagataella phaffii GS115]|uniref:Integral membrane protein required for efficient mating n=2 Tax=Komagataella phaffii TaxID=460519 RepID=C4QXD3_KOMPG|nr:Integral membrane protein required for efficient mating [Komagataella phaffii GS115]CAY67906.1 Integral membrane protein required for efficient mating [Komagataella phaffii GS115]
MLFLPILYLRKCPRVILLLTLFTTFFLLAFLLMGASKPAKSFSSIYLVEYKFNQTSPMFPLLEQAYKNQDAKGLSLMSVKAGYMGICVDTPKLLQGNSTDEMKELGSQITCTSRDSIGKFNKDFMGVSLYSSGTNTTAAFIDLVSIVDAFSNRMVKPYLLMAILVLSICLFCNLLYSALPFMPCKPIAERSALVLSTITSFLWGVGAMWSHVASHSISIVQPSSMRIITGKVGLKAEIITWISFSFLLAVCLGCWGLYLRDRRNTRKAVLPIEKKLRQGL